jgi:hypothetical protein
MSLERSFRSIPISCGKVKSAANMRLNEGNSCRQCAQQLVAEWLQILRRYGKSSASDASSQSRGRIKPGCNHSAPGIGAAGVKAERCYIHSNNDWIVRWH